MLGSYFVYDTAYLNPVTSMMIQYYVFGLEDSQKDTPALIEIEMDNSYNYEVTQNYYIYTVYYIVYVYVITI